MNPNVRLWLIFLLIMPACCLSAAAGDLQAACSPRGLASLSYRGVDLLGNGDLVVEGVTLQKPDGSVLPADMKGARVTADPAKGLLAQEYPWGRVQCAYAVQDDRLAMTVQVANTSPYVIRGIWLRLLQVRFPRLPQGWDPQGHMPHLSFNGGSPTIITADYGDGTATFCNEDVTRPLIAGFTWAVDKPACRTYDVIARSSNFGWLGSLLDKVVQRPIPPGGTDQYAFTLRFGAPGVPVDGLIADLAQRFGEAYPLKLTWEDRRPIGALFLSAAGLGSASNPRGWFNDKNLSLATEADRAKFRERLLAWADGCVRVLKDMNAQGMITWDIEGQEFPHATSYLGDPRSLPTEIDALADEYFAKFRDAGLRVGICVRPQVPVRRAYGGGVMQIEVDDPARNLIDKIAYAKKRWGCTLFYVDSNGDPNVPISALIFKQVAEAHPDVLLMPEQKNLAYYAYTAPYQSFSHFGVPSTPAWVRQAYPKAFSAIYVPDGPFDKFHKELVDGVRHGDILLFRGWFNDSANEEVKRIYAEAAK